MWQDYQDEVEIWGIASHEDPEVVGNFRDQLGITFPLLLDHDGSVLEQYEQVLAFQGTAYPQDWIIDPDGKVAYVNNAYDPVEIASILDELLGR